MERLCTRSDRELRDALGESDKDLTPDGRRHVIDQHKVTMAIRTKRKDGPSPQPSPSIKVMTRSQLKKSMNEGMDLEAPAKRVVHKDAPCLHTPLPTKSNPSPTRKMMTRSMSERPRAWVPDLRADHKVRKHLLSLLSCFNIIINNLVIFVCFKTMTRSMLERPRARVSDLKADHKVRKHFLSLFSCFNILKHFGSLCTLQDMSCTKKLQQVNAS